MMMVMFFVFIVKIQEEEAFEGKGRTQYDMLVEIGGAANEEIDMENTQIRFIVVLY